MLMGWGQLHGGINVIYGRFPQVVDEVKGDMLLMALQRKQILLFVLLDIVKLINPMLFHIFSVACPAI